MRTRLALGIVAVSFCLAGVRLAWSSKAAPAPAGEGGGATSAPDHGFAGNASCSAAACHGRAEPLTNLMTQQNEYTFSLAHDKHLRAYDTLKSDRAKQMAKNLAEGQGTKLIEAHLDERCLACHTTPQAAKLPVGKTEPDAALLSWREGGVSCEACHGPAMLPNKEWLGKHTTGDWKGLSPAQKADYGKANLASQKVQAEMCAGCHVGAAADEKNGVPARDLNHDLMAAGHPRLTFELATYRANQPAHWNAALKQKERKGQSDADYEANAWAAGRVASARASLDLLIHRAQQALAAKQAKSSTVRWPEFAEYRCIACHADFNAEWRLRERDPNRAPGSLPYDPWHYTLLPELNAARKSGASTFDVQKEYDALIAAMASPYPKEDDIIVQAKKVRQSLDDWLKSMGGSATTSGIEFTGLPDAIIKNAQKIPRTWEETTQLALAADALKPAERKALDDLFKALAYPAKDDSPAGFLGPPAARQSVKDAFPKLQQMMKK